MIGIVNYGMGNVGSIKNMIEYVGGECIIIDSPKELDRADKLIIPGVGAFDNGMTRLGEGGFVEGLNEHVKIRKKPVLGICLGMQLLALKSEEGVMPGLGWINAEAIRFNFKPEENTQKLRVPHMGWNTVEYKKETKLNVNISEKPRYYFVHTYHVVCKSEKDILCTCEYGHSIVAGVAHENVYGLQFHPEKSHKFGMAVFKNFIMMAAC